MRSLLCGLGFTALTVFGLGAELSVDFARDTIGQAPAGFRSVLSGQGKAGDWQIVRDATASAFTPLTTHAPVVAGRSVLAQLSRDPTDERFPLLVYDAASFGDFTLSVRFKLVEGAIEQMAGIAFRLKDEKNYYVLRASGLGNTLRFYKVIDGVRGRPVGVDVPVPKGVWHELGVEAKGNQIRCLFNGQLAFPEVTDLSLTDGKLAFWTKSDSVTYFSDLKLTYVPRESLAQTLVKQMLERYPRLRGLRIYATTTAKPQLHVVASHEPKDLGQPAEKVEHDAIATDTIYAGKVGGAMLVTAPLHDRNGDAIAAVRVALEPFPGQTKENAVARALPIVRKMEAQTRSLKELTE